MDKKAILAEIEQVNYQLAEYANFVSSEEYREGYTPEALKKRRELLRQQLESIKSS